MTDVREFNKLHKDKPGIMVDLDKAADELKVPKISLTKWNRPLLVAWLERQGIAVEKG